MNHRGQRGHNILFTEPVLNRNIGFYTQKKGFSAFLEAKGGCLGASNVVTEAGPGVVVVVAVVVGEGGHVSISDAISAALHLHYRRPKSCEKLSLRAPPKRLRQISHGHVGHSLPFSVLLIGK